MEAAHGASSALLYIASGTAKDHHHVAHGSYSWTPELGRSVGTGLELLDQVDLPQPRPARAPLLHRGFSISQMTSLLPA